MKNNLENGRELYLRENKSFPFSSSCFHSAISNFHLSEQNISNLDCNNSSNERRRKSSSSLEKADNDLLKNKSERMGLRSVFSRLKTTNKAIPVTDYFITKEHRMIVVRCSFFDLLHTLFAFSGESNFT